MDIQHYLDSTYLKTASQAGLSERENKEVVRQTILDAIRYNFKLVMLRPEYVAMAKQMILEANSNVTVGTVIDFPKGEGSLQTKLDEASKAIEKGADDLDFVVNYNAFKEGKIEEVKTQVLVCTQLGLESGKIVKWIIEIAALSATQIIQLTALIKNVVIANFKEKDYHNVFVKSSTGFYKTEDGVPNGATVPAIKMMLENACPLPVKAAGGVRNYKEAQEMIALGVKRIGTSAAKAIVEGEISQSDY